jgi:hypothetical protein
MLRHVAHLPVFVWTWETFFTVAVGRFILQLRASGANAGLLRHCFPAAIWRQKFSWIDIMLYLGSKLIAKLRLIYDLVSMSVVVELTLRVRSAGWRRITRWLRPTTSLCCSALWQSSPLLISPIT